jgi:uncharacterized membrane protein
MRPIGWFGILLVALGIVILAMRGLSYTKDRQEISVGPMKVAAEQKGFVPPAVGFLAIAVGAGLVFVGTRRRA